MADTGQDRALRILVVEDETAATVNILALLTQVCPGAEVVATTETVDDTAEWLAANTPPDVILMDIHLADGSAFRIFDKVAVGSPVIFTTAYDRYALEAFRVNSIDYLLKPVKAGDLRRALDKLSHLTGIAARSYAERVEEMAVGRNNPSALLIRTADKIIPLRAQEIAYAYSTDENVTLHTTDKRMLPYDKSLAALEGELPEHDFFRANRQFVVSRSAITDISVWFGGRLCVNLSHQTPERIIVSKARTPLFKAWLKEG